MAEKSVMGNGDGQWVMEIGNGQWKSAMGNGNRQLAMLIGEGQWVWGHGSN
jgi:hypothetical protein